MAIRPQLKSLTRQTIVITGATSGIGLATTRMAVQRGAAVVLVARNVDALKTISEELRAKGGRVAIHEADVGDPDQVDAVARMAEEAFGGFDSWVNNASAFIFGRTDEIPLQDHRRIFDTVYWGVVHGSLTAARTLRYRGGAIVNVGSVLGDRALALQGPYSDAKHAVKGITDTLRMEFEEAGLPISVTLVKPGPIDTPYVDHARNWMPSVGTRNPPPVYDARLVARAILHACRWPIRDLYVGSGGLATTLAGTLAPRLTDMVMELGARSAQSSDQPAPAERLDNLHVPRQDNAEQGARSPGFVRRRSLILEAQINPVATLVRQAGDTALTLGRDTLRGLLRGRA
ncbi:MAG: SDR family oxidoreductase [Rhodopila sp.]